jgi:glycosyltransferase involved in cell wall biosynthesis
MAQTFGNLELIFIDDGSTDESYQILTRYPGIKTLRQKNRGPAAARNSGLEYASGEIIHFLDSDVIAPPDLIEIHVALHEIYPHHIIQGQVVRILDLADAFKVTMSVRHYARPFFATGNVSVRRKFIEAVGGFDELNFRKGWEDLDLGLRLIEKGIAVKRLYKKGFVWHVEADISKEEEIHEFFKSRYLEGKSALNFYRKHPTFSVRMMTMTGTVFFFLDSLLFNDSYLRSERFIHRLRSLWERGRKGKAVSVLRWAATHFYLQGVKDRIREDGYTLKRGRDVDFEN